ncbi:MAG: hypothetical protein HY525_00790 [Betaproteobacteria bacterium]|nr:hypothetical protein [Betaproteobacteria bacterium]
MGHILALAIVVAPSYADPPKQVFGIYTRPTLACGGPGLADGGGSCDLVAEDRLEVTAGIDLRTASADSVYVSFALHFDAGKGDHLCAFSGHGTWSNGKVLLGEAENPVRPERKNIACRLALSYTKGTIRVLDARSKCQPSLCSGAHKLDGVVFKKQSRKQ